MSATGIEAGGPGRWRSELWTAATSASSDRYTMDDRGMPSPLLMERAALCVSQEVVALAMAEGRAVGVLVGPGNNGGDGLAVARQLHGWGVSVAAWLLAERYNPAVAEQLRLCRAYGVTVHEGMAADEEAGRLWVDALLGTGSRGAPRGRIGVALRWLRARAGPCVAIDLPTGVDPDTGAVAEDAVRARCTVTFGRSKPGLHVTPGRHHAGRVVVADIGLLPPPGLDDRLRLLDPEDVAAALRGLPAGAHKGERGHLGIVGGSPGTTGAALLAGVAGLRGGAGLVTVASPDPTLATVLLAVRPELMTASMQSEPARLLPRARALVVGPGLTDAASQAMLPRLFVEDPRPALWDASALDLLPVLGGDPAGPRVITPHPGEAGRLLRRLAPDEGWTGTMVQGRRIEAARRLAVATKAVVVLKGEGSLVATPEGAVAVAVSGGPALATAGSGDVLAGLGGALLARGLPPSVAAEVAVHVHGVAGERLGEAAGAVALDVAEALPSALRAVMDAPDHPRWPALRRG
ncbi:NAD(P)H-hydrate dehydratase [Paraliomyxa miuraensis]|uniref:NAD(P)H-hydrate dehydratase n=1 Tax=Paraliomyxa miuraensis TaxID=376150 RepID=UPI0022523A76|nr:NAD(P)H-hydrate dehydratase [Paraliomyxa miuraensis]MCX4244601.1 NAD(P)H-hydrate dehydratase [Paraliomyxa miuraensis]